MANGKLISTLLEDAAFPDFLSFTDALVFPDDFLSFADALVFRDDLPPESTGSDDSVSTPARWLFPSSSTKLSSTMSSWCHPS